MMDKEFASDVSDNDDDDDDCDGNDNGKSEPAATSLISNGGNQLYNLTGFHVENNMMAPLSNIQ